MRRSLPSSSSFIRVEPSFPQGAECATWLRRTQLYHKLCLKCNECQKSLEPRLLVDHDGAVRSAPSGRSLPSPRMPRLTAIPDCLRRRELNRTCTGLLQGLLRKTLWRKGLWRRYFFPLRLWVKCYL